MGLIYQWTEEGQNPCNLEKLLLFEMCCGCKSTAISAMDGSAQQGINLSDEIFISREVKMNGKALPELEPNFIG